MKCCNSSWKVLLIAIVAGSAVAAGVGIRGCDAQGTQPAKTMVIGQGASGKEIVVSGVETVSIKLSENASTGYHWVVASVDGTSVKSTDDVKHEANPKQDMRPGSGGEYFADFRVIGSGKTKVTLEYRRPWEKDTAPAETFSVTLDVQGPATTTTAPATHPAK